jgi:hypothetical protein
MQLTCGRWQRERTERSDVLLTCFLGHATASAAWLGDREARRRRRLHPAVLYRGRCAGTGPDRDSLALAPLPFTPHQRGSCERGQRQPLAWTTPADVVADLGQRPLPQAVLGEIAAVRRGRTISAQVRIPRRGSPRVSRASCRVTNSQVKPETRGRSSGLDPRRVPYNMGTRRHQPERRVCGSRRRVAVAATRPTVAVTRPRRARLCCAALRQPGKES